ncbi:hypothetical protein PGB90_006652 [Kerria lacca]
MGKKNQQNDIFYGSHRNSWHCVFHKILFANIVKTFNPILIIAVLKNSAEFTAVIKIRDFKNTHSSDLTKQKYEKIRRFKNT